MQQITYLKLFGLHLLTSRNHSYFTSQAGTMQSTSDSKILETCQLLIFKSFLRPPNTEKLRFVEWFLSMCMSVRLSECTPHGCGCPWNCQSAMSRPSQVLSTKSAPLQEQQAPLTPCSTVC